MSEREKQIAAKAREWAKHYPQSSDGRNTFICFAEWVESLPSIPAQGMLVAWRWRPRGAAAWIYNPEAQWLAEHKDEVESEPLYAPTPAQEWKPVGFLEAMNIVERGFNAWKDKPHNAGWFRRIDGTPIPNDLKVNIAEVICHSTVTSTECGSK